MNYCKFLIFYTVLFTIAISCSQKSEQEHSELIDPQASSVYCVNTDDLKGFQFLDQRYLQAINNIETSEEKKQDFTDMVLIKGGSFDMGADQPAGFEDMPSTALAQADEFPKHKVRVGDFYMDDHEVTVGEYLEFVNATGYITVAEQSINWEELKKQLPPDTAKPDDDLLQAGSMLFFYPSEDTKKDNLANWWRFEPGISWKKPTIDSISIQELLNYPVNHISWYDAMAYAKWANKRLPTEAEYEYALRAGKENNMYPWGNEKINSKTYRGNFLQGEFPYTNTVADGFERRAPIKSFEPNDYGLFDIAGNLWEWTNDWYGANYYKLLDDSGTIANNPEGPEQTFEVYNPTATNKVVRGGSFLCNDDWCSGYRNARRMRLSPDSSMEHLGFRLVRSAN